jgi:cell division protein ZapA
MSAKQIEVQILGQPYRLSCSPESEPVLRESVARVDSEMNKVRSQSPIRGTDRIAVMAALSIASELLNLQQSVRHGEAFPAEEIRRTIERMNEQIDSAVQRASHLGS